MKLTKKIAIALFTLVVFSVSCKDSFLTVPPTGQLDLGQLSTLKGADAALIAVYAQLSGRGNRMASPSNWVWGSIRGGEANKGTDPGDFSDINPIQIYQALPTQGVISDHWSGSYEGIARANAVLKITTKITPVSTADIDTKKRIEAEAKFLRAHYYFQLVRNFDKVPYVDETTDETTINGVKNDVSVWPKIEADMLSAYQNLPATQSAKGRANKWAAGAYLGKIYLQQKKYTDAKTVFDAVIADGVTASGDKYGLLASYPDVFRATNDNSIESVFAIQAAANTGSINNANPEFDLNWPYNTGPDGPGNCCSFFQPSFELANSFRTAGGKPLLDGSYNVGANQLVTDQGKESKVAFTTDTDPLDPRIDYSIGRRYIQYLDWKPFPGKDWIRNQGNGGPYAPKKFIYYKSDKGTLQDNSSWTPGYTALNFPIIRFADVLLMAAECEIEVAGGSLAKALDYVNQVRTRAANPAAFVKGVVTGFTGGDFTKPIMDYTQNAANYVIANYVVGDMDTQDKARKVLRFERKLELSGEGHRFYDLVRWGIAKAEIDAYLAYEKTYLSGTFDGASFEANKDELLPIPQGQIDIVTSSVLKQNPGF